MCSIEILEAPSLDEQYLKFATCTASVFEQYPQIEALRYSIFKELLTKRSAVGWASQIKKLLRPLVSRRHSTLVAQPTDVLLVVESRREVIVDALVPVYRELTSRGISAMLLSVQGPEGLPDSTVKFCSQPSFASPKWAKRAWKALSSEIEALQDRSLERTFVYQCSHIQGMFEELDRVLVMFKPRLVLVASTQMWGGAAMVVAARTRKITSLLLQHGILQAFYTPVPADYMLTWGQSSNDTLVRFGVDEEKLVALGSPRHDSMSPSGGGVARATLLQKLSLQDLPTLVFFSNGNDLVRNANAPVECASWLEAAAAQYSGRVNVVVRLHPNEDGSLYANMRNLRVTKDSLDLGTTLDGCDAVASLCSTVLYDGLLYRKSVLQFYANGWPELADNWRNRLAERMSSEAELITWIGKTLLEPGAGFFDESVLDRVFANHGFAAASVAEFVEGKLRPSLVQSGGADFTGAKQALACSGPETNLGALY